LLRAEPDAVRQKGGATRLFHVHTQENHGEQSINSSEQFFDQFEQINNHRQNLTS
jgi:hypothetical protein